MPSYDRALHALRTWLDSWPGIGHVAVGMHRQGYDLQLTTTTSAAGARHDTTGDGALAHERDGNWVGADAVAGGSGRRVASVAQRKRRGRRVDDSGKDVD